MGSKENIPNDERVRLMNLFYPEMGIRIRAKKHLTIGYTYEMMWDFVYRAYELGKQGQQQAAAQVRAQALLEAARAVCITCRLGKMGITKWRGSFKHTDIDGRVVLDCEADAIRQLMEGYKV